MTRTVVISSLLAAAVHLAALFGLRDRTPAMPLPLAPESVEVELITATPTPEPAVEIPTEPTPEPTPEPEPEPVIPPTPEPPPEPTPAPVSEPAAIETPTPPVITQPTAKAVKKLQSPAKKPSNTRPKPQPSPAVTGGTRPGVAAGPIAKKVGPNTSIRVRSNPAPSYPAAARQARQEGTVTLDVQVSAAGVPVSVNLAKSSGFASLDQAAITAVRRWSFTPATVAGTATSGRVRVPVRFKLSR